MVFYFMMKYTPILFHEVRARRFHGSSHNHRMGRGKAWTSSEDEQLCQSWLVTSEDPLTGTGQKAGWFWERVHECFVKFCGRFSKVKSLERLGWSSDMYVDECMKVWKQKEKKMLNSRSRPAGYTLKINRNGELISGNCQKKPTSEPQLEAPIRPIGNQMAKDANRRNSTPVKMAE